MQKVSFKRYYANFLLVDVLIWFVGVPIIISMNIIPELHAPSIMEYVWWQVLGFGSFWLAYHLAVLEKKKR